MKQIFLALLFTGLLFSCRSNNGITKNSIPSGKDTIFFRPDFKKYFDNCNTNGSIVIYDNVQQKWIVSDTDDIMKETLPASTFKIINLLIALETKTISSENEIVKWPGSTDTIKYDYRPAIYHDMTVKEAFEVSAGWAFIELAKKIGKENYKKYLTLCNYGNLNLSQKEDDFWNFGDFAISPVNQVKFIKKLYEEKLPFSKRNIEIVKKVMITEKTDNYTIHAKTGWTRENGINTGWWVGYIENKTGTYFFATRLLQDRKSNSSNFGSCRKEITKSVFIDLNIIK
ncbi:penicillin-binding transpeptidase domain-containing protein [Flavobacterium sp. LS1R49]|uniref:beta-lactamase n=2 Tax=Flavobacterium shii TaxID=2987687 RepID=A0A9X2ZG94_9FLAO|nr:penicillin-binding transpeptidase domain-containing protein [Flavobacterium shii]MCV9930564.1 penicillin-binding transpeptidase domain-containing protein [Flavobacterium shii]